jgi:signal recognition particle GTPase
MATQEICRALVESDVNIKVVSTLRKGIKDKINLEDAPPGKGHTCRLVDTTHDLFISELKWIKTLLWRIFAKML